MLVTNLLILLTLGWAVGTKIAHAASPSDSISPQAVFASAQRTFEILAPIYRQGSWETFEPKVKDGHLIYVKGDKNTAQLVVDDTSYPLPDEFYAVGGTDHDQVLILANGDVAYTVEVSGLFFGSANTVLKVYLNGRDISGDYRFKDFKFLTQLNGKLAFSPNTDSREQVIYYDQGYLKTEGEVISIFAVNGKLGYSERIPARPGLRLMLEGQEVLPEFAGNIAAAFVIEEKLGFHSRDSKFIYYDGKKYGQEFARVSAPVEYRGQAAFVGEKTADPASGQAQNRYFLMAGDENLGSLDGYENISDLAVVDGHLYARLRINDQTFPSYDGQPLDNLPNSYMLYYPPVQILDPNFNAKYKQVAQTYSAIRLQKEIVPGMVTLIAQDKDGKYFVIHGDQQFGPYPDIDFVGPIHLNNQLFYLAGEGFASTAEWDLYVEGNKIYEGLPFGSNVYAYRGKLIIFDSQNILIER